MKHAGGTGRLIGGVPGVKPAEVLIIGGGVSGFHAAQMATGHRVLMSRFLNVITTACVSSMNISMAVPTSSIRMPMWSSDTYRRRLT
jgi:alanine dehydrogenase